MTPDPKNTTPTRPRATPSYLCSQPHAAGTGCPMGRARRDSTKRSTIASASKAKTTEARIKTGTPKQKKTSSRTSDEAFYASLRIYLSCVSTLGALFLVLYLMRPPPPTGSSRSRRVPDTRNSTKMPR